MKKILITGSNGLLGQKLLDKLHLQSDITLLATSKGSDRYGLKPAQYEALDITQKKEVIELVQKFKPDVIIHTAAMTNVDACETSRDECWTMNVHSIEYLMEAALPIKSHIIHLSTDFIFDGADGPYREDDIAAPLSHYGHSKNESEIVLKKYPYSWSILRTIIVYGIVKDMSRSNIVLWAKKALSEKKEIQVVSDQFRSPTLAEDLADACISAALKGKTGIYNVSGKDFMSILELVERVASHYGLDKSLIKPIKSDSLNQAAKRPPRTGFILDKAIRELEYNPHSFEEGMYILDEQLKKLNL